jgi:UDP-N-acetylmuramoyl-L-alanyl-D-glutamate--2,6-diaminopimelate ligase
VAAVAFDVAVLTNITHEALEYHGTFEAYAEAKAMLFHALAQAPRKPGVAKTSVLNAADPAAARLRQVPVDRVLEYGVSLPAAFSAQNVRHTPAGLAFTARTPQGALELRTPLIGFYNAANILAAMAASSALGAGPEAWTAGVAAVPAIPGRMEPVTGGQSFTALVDFAHTPNALRQALTAVRELAASGGRVIAVFGCAGLRDPAKRPLMGRVAGELADVTVVTAEDPRSEDPAGIIGAIAGGLEAAGAREGRSYHRVADRFQAIRTAVGLARAGDVVIVCGKGHEQSMAFGDVEFPWDDRKALAAALAGASYGQLPTSPPQEG